jgi:adenylate cyclase
VVPLAADDPTLARAVAEARDASQERRKREFGALVQELTRRRPLVLCLDDVHWADPSSVDLLAYLACRCDTLRLLIVVTYRPSELLLREHPFGPIKLELQGRGVCREIAVSFLGRADLDRYLELLFPGHQLPETFAAVIHDRTEGNPLFMVDLLRYLRDRGIVRQDEGRWGLAKAVPEVQRELPESVRGMIQRKVDQLDKADRRLLMAGAVQGREFDAAVVARVVGRDAADVEERLDVLDRLYGLVRRVRVHEFPDGTPTLRYTFVHVLYQNALFEALTPTRKAAWSAAAAQALLDHNKPNPVAVATELGFLFEAARDFGRAVEFFLLAARHAVEVAAHPEAAALARRGLDLLPRVSDGPARNRQELGLLLALGVSLVATKGFAAAEVEATYARARALCQQGAELATLFPVLYGLWNLYLVRCELNRCNELATQMLLLAEGQADPAYLLIADNALHQPLFHGGELRLARQYQERGVARYDPARHAALTASYGEDPGVGFLAYGAVTLWLLGYPDRAARAVREALDLAERLGNPFNRAQALYFCAQTHLSRRDYRRAQELADALLLLADEHGFVLQFAGGLVLHGRCIAELGRADEGLAEMRDGLARWRATGAVSHRPYHLALLAEVFAGAGRRDDARAALAEAQAVAEAIGERFWDAELYRLQGDLSPAGDAEACFERALDTARRQEAKALELRAAMSWARLGHPQRRATDARARLVELCAWFREGFDTADLQEAQALRAGLAP